MLNEARFPKVGDKKDTYPMDFYSDEGGKWSNYWKRNEEKKERLAARKKAKVVEVKYE